MALFPLSLNHSALYQILNQSWVYYLIAISTSAYYKLDLWIRVVLLVEPLQVPDILGVQLLHVLLTGVGDLLRRDRCPHHQCDRLPGNPFMIIFKTKVLFTHLCGTIPKLYWKMPRPRKTTGANPAIEVRKSWMLLRTEPSLLSSCENTSNQKNFTLQESPTLS